MVFIHWNPVVRALLQGRTFRVAWQKDGVDARIARCFPDVLGQLGCLAENRRASGKSCGVEKQ